MSSKCLFCDYSIPENSKFCPMCGRSKEVAAKDRLIENRFQEIQKKEEENCRDCGHKILENSVYCSGCGCLLKSIWEDANLRNRGRQREQAKIEIEKKFGKKSKAEIEGEENLLEYPFNLIIPILVISFFVFLIIFGILSK